MEEKLFRVELIMSDVYSIKANSAEEAERIARDKLGCDYLIDRIVIVERKDNGLDCVVMDKKF